MPKRLHVNHERKVVLVVEHLECDPVVAKAVGLNTDGNMVSRNHGAVTVVDILLVQNRFLNRLLNAAVVRHVNVALQPVFQVNRVALSHPVHLVKFKVLESIFFNVENRRVVHNDDVVVVLESQRVIHGDKVVSNVAICN